jgi:hypothetical protein
VARLRRRSVRRVHALRAAGNLGVKGSRVVASDDDVLTLLFGDVARELEAANDNAARREQRIEWLEKYWSRP